MHIDDLHVCGFFDQMICVMTNIAIFNPFTRYEAMFCVYEFMLIKTMFRFAYTFTLVAFYSIKRPIVTSSEAHITEQATVVT